MLPEIRLDTENFQDLLEEYRAMIAGIYPEWTNYNYPDPGMTFLELFAWLTENQQFYMEQLGDSHYRQFFRLLNFAGKGLKPASVFAVPKESAALCILKKSRFMAGGMIFETVEEENLPGDTLIRAEVLDGEGKLVAEAGHHWLSCMGEMQFFPFGQQPRAGTECRLYFAEPLSVGKLYHLSVQLERNLLERNSSEWNSLERNSPEWNSLERNSLERRRVGERNPLIGETFYPLAKWEWSVYCAGGWKPLALRKDETSQFLFDGRIHFVLDEAMAPVPQKDGAYGLRVVLKESYYDFPPLLSGITMNQILLVQKETWERETPLLLGEGNGFPAQQFALPWQKVMADSVKLEVEDPMFPGLFQKWRRVEQFSGCGPEDLCYQVDEDQGVISFGDGFCGMTPEGKIRVLSMERTWGGACSIKEKTAMVWNNREFFVSGQREKGSSTETVREALYRLGTEKTERRRIVTAADYEEAVKATPGLVIYSCKVLRERSGENQVSLVVRPGNGKQRLALSGAYRKNILNWLDKKRMMGTRIQLYGPEYIEVSVYLEVSVMPQYRRAREMIIEAVEEWFSCLGASFGVPISYGEFYGKLDSLPCIRRLRSLSLTAKSPGVHRSQSGDLIPPANGVFLLEQVEYISIND